MQKDRNIPARNIPPGSGEEGFMLLGAVVLVFLMLLALSVAAAKVSLELRREREVEAIHRGNEYVRGIQLYYRKLGHYPGNMEQLEKSNNIRFLRQKYVDPMTGKPDWRLIHLGEAKTTVKGFFGQPLAGLPGSSGGLGAAASMASPNQGGNSTVNGSSSNSFGSGSSGFGSSGANIGSSSPSGTNSSSGFSQGSPGLSSGNPSTGTVGSSTPGGSTGSASSPGSSQSSGFGGGGGAIVGVGSSRSGDSITILNEQTTYQTWEFLYDPRIEQLKAKAALLSGASSTGTNGFGTGTAPATPTNNNPFGNSIGSPPSTSTTPP